MVEGRCITNMEWDDHPSSFELVGKSLHTHLYRLVLTCTDWYRLIPLLLTSLALICFDAGSRSHPWLSHHPGINRDL